MGPWTFLVQIAGTRLYLTLLAQLLGVLAEHFHQSHYGARAHKYTLRTESYTIRAIFRPLRTKVRCLSYVYGYMDECSAFRKWACLLGKAPPHGGEARSD